MGFAEIYKKDVITKKTEIKLKLGLNTDEIKSRLMLVCTN